MRSRTKIARPRRFDWVTFVAFFGAVGVLAATFFTPHLQAFVFPFRMLGTVVHEIGHGVAAILVGGEFLRFQVFENLSGLAFRTTLPPVPTAFVAAAGLLAPSIFGAVILLLSAKVGWHRLALLMPAIGIALAATTKFDGPLDASWLYGASLFFVAAAFGPVVVRALAAQLTGLNLCLQALFSHRYAMMETAHVDGETRHSDTARIAEHLGGEPWMYGAAIIAITLLIVVPVVLFAVFGRLSRAKSAAPQPSPL